MHIKLSNITLEYQGIRAVDDVSLEIETSQCIGLIGPNGAGKTTLLNILAGSLRPQMGVVELEGRRVKNATPHDFAKCGIARTFQHTRPFYNQTVYENIFTAALLKHEKQAAEFCVQELLVRLDLTRIKDSDPSTCDTLQLKKLELARCLAIDPKVLLLDELMAGLRHEEITALQTILEQELLKGRTILFIEHNLNYVRKFAERVLVMNFGRLIADGTPEDVFADKNVIESYVGH